MGKTYVLDRVSADLARGFTHPAIQRLSSLVAAHPHDLDLRRRLAAVYRRAGNRIQAGRWDYLTIGADTRDTRAFERAFPSAAARLREVRWPYRASEAATAYARSRLAKLIAAAEAERPAGRATGPAPGSRTRATGPAGRPSSRSDRTAWRAGVDRLARASRQWRDARVWRLNSPPVAVATVVTAPLVVIGVATVVEWIVQ